VLAGRDQHLAAQWPPFGGQLVSSARRAPAAIIDFIAWNAFSTAEPASASATIGASQYRWS
jgi:hypothetical protein